MSNIKKVYKQIYLNLVDSHIQKYGEDSDSTESISTVSEIVGYYIYAYGDEALNMWERNLKLSRWEHESDRGVTRVLSELYK